METISVNKMTEANGQEIALGLVGWGDKSPFSHPARSPSYSGKREMGKKKGAVATTALGRLLESKRARPSQAAPS